jgi:hypothetical protein
LLRSPAQFPENGVRPVDRGLSYFWWICASASNVKVTVVTQLSLDIAAKHMMPSYPTVDLAENRNIPVKPVEVTVEYNCGPFGARHQFNGIQRGTVAVESANDI